MPWPDLRRRFTCARGSARPPIIAAGVARLPGILPYGPFAFFGIAYGLSLAGLAYDQWSRGRIHRVYYWAIPLLVLSVPGRLMLSTTAAWRSFAEFVTR